MNIIIEYDRNKSNMNSQKHGISFAEAIEMFKDPDMLELKAKSVEEPRYLLIGKIKEKHWSAIVTYRAEKVRFISVRRARKEEVDFYENQRS